MTLAVQYCEIGCAIHDLVTTHAQAYSFSSDFVYSFYFETVDRSAVDETASTKEAIVLVMQKLFDPKKYDKRVRPVAEAEQTLDVKMEVQLKSMFEVCHCHEGNIPALHIPAGPPHLLYFLRIHNAKILGSTVRCGF